MTGTWETSRLKYGARLNPPVPARIRSMDNELVSFVPMEAIGEDWSLDASRRRPVQELLAGYSYFEDGDLLMAKVTPCFENGKATIATGLTQGSGFGTTEVTVVRATGFDPRFLFYVINEDRFRQGGVADMTGAGGLKRVPDSTVRDFKVAHPQIDEQREIANFLDRETGEIDAFIRDQEELIGLLQERRAVTISHAVTKGLDGDVPLVGSETDLPGDIPATWKVRRLGTVIRQRKRVVGDTWDSHRLLSLTLRGVIPRDLDNIVGKLPADFTTYQRVRADDLVLCLFDVHETPRTVGLAREDGMVTGAYTVVRVTSPEVLPSYLAMVYLAYDQYKLLRPFYAGLRNTIRSQDLKAIPIPLPSLPEQMEIVEYVERATGELDSAISDARQAILLSKERRSALISAAVTGQIDVREHVGV